jgi:hypothetical protein
VAAELGGRSVTDIATALVEGARAEAERGNKDDLTALVLRRDAGPRTAGGKRRLTAGDG